MSVPTLDMDLTIAKQMLDKAVEWADRGYHDKAAGCAAVGTLAYTIAAAEAGMRAVRRLEAQARLDSMADIPRSPTASR